MPRRRCGFPRKFISKKKLQRAGEPVARRRISKHKHRFWDYAATPSRKVDELTSILIESATSVEDPDAPKDISPLESQRLWDGKRNRICWRAWRRAGCWRLRDRWRKFSIG